MVQKEIVLITGAAGFIGSHTCERMLQEGFYIVGIDNINDYYDVKLKRDNIKLLKEYDHFEFIEADIINYDELNSIFTKHSFNNIIHIAAQAGVRYSLENPFIYQEVNVGGTLNLLELARYHSCDNFIFASSSSVYGNQKKVPFSEDDPISKPISIYASTKLAGEALCYSYHHLYDININCLRFFTVYGPRGRPDMSPHIFTSKILQGLIIELYDDPSGTIKRDFTFIDDIVEGIIKAFKYKGGFEIFNLGFGKPIGLKYFLSILEDYIGKKAKLEYHPRQPGDVDITYADTSKAKQILGFEPKINVEEGIREYVSWFKQYYNFS
ncbi:MAG: GDP-mannose 4,6-dehydratase [Candidatus Hodarchaeota archaeon]